MTDRFDRLGIELVGEEHEERQLGLGLGSQLDQVATHPLYAVALRASEEVECADLVAHAFERAAEVVLLERKTTAGVAVFVPHRDV